MKPKVFVTRTLPKAGLERIVGKCDAEIWPHDGPPSYETLLERVEGVAGLLYTLTDRIDAGLLDAAGPNLRVLSGFAVGYDNVDVAAATARGIPVGNTPGVLTKTTADLAFALLLSAARRIVEGADYAKSGKWQAWSPTLLLGRDVFGATLGIWGMGRIGRAVARRARGFDMRVIYRDSSPASAVEEALGTPVGLDELLGESDFLSLHVPLTAETHHIVNADTLAKMRPEAILINTARGPVVDHDALYAALKNGTIGYAALDVTEPEPLPNTHKLHSLPNCLIVPHVGSASVATRDKMAKMAAQNLLAGLGGERLPNCVNPEVYDATKRRF